MGVKLGEIIHKKQIEFEDLKNKKIAIDFSNMAYQFLSSIRQQDGTPLQDSEGNITSVYVGLTLRIPNLLSKQIYPCFIFDGLPPILKIKTQEERAYRKRIAEGKLREAKEAEDIPKMLKYSKQTIRLNKKIIETSKELLKAFGLPVIQSPSESDSQIAHMCEKGDVWAGASSDLDLLLQGCPKTITNLTVTQKRKLSSGAYIKTTPELIELKQVLKDLKISQDQLIVVAILTGTDYNPGGVSRIGPKTALKLVREYKNFDELFEKVEASFNWKQIYAVFKSMPIMKNYQLKFKEPDQDKISDILLKHDFSKERVEKILEKITKRKKDQKGLNEF